MSLPDRNLAFHSHISSQPQKNSRITKQRNPKRILIRLVLRSTYNQHGIKQHQTAEQNHFRPEFQLEFHKITHIMNHKIQHVNGQ